jgi:dual specificity tyrosine-phosphorylation-regulated kinase 2/3/4
MGTAAPRPPAPNPEPPSRDPTRPLFCGPVKPLHVLSNFQEYLTDHEQTEILQFRDIWYLRLVPPSQPKAPLIIPETFQFVADDHIAYRYTQEKVIGNGAFGSVIQCYDHKRRIHVAIKLLRDRPKVHSQIAFEVELMIQLQKRDGEDDHHIIRYIEHFTFRGFFCIVMELCSLDVYTVLKNQRFVGFPMTTVQMVARETADALAFIHSRGIMHCDIKPENILFTTKAKDHIKVIDYGCSCFVGKTIFTYIQSRYYRAPEVVLGMDYGKEIDIWSLACVICEMVSGYPLFCADDEAELVELIVQMRGLPPLEFVKQAPRGNLYFDAAGKYKLKPGPRPKAVGSLAEATRVRDSVFLDFLDKCLRWAPSDRMTAAQMLEHPWVKSAGARPLVAMPLTAR